MADELRIRIVAEDEASAKLSDVRRELEGVSTGTQQANTDAEAWSSTLTSQVVPAVDATEASSMRLSRAMLPVSFGLRQLGLQGPATFVTMAASATGASIAVDGTTVSVGALTIALGPLVIIIAALIALFVALIAVMAAAAAVGKFLGDSFRMAFDSSATPAARRLHESLSSLGAVATGLKIRVGTALMQAFGPALAWIADLMTTIIAHLPVFAANIVNSIIGVLNKAGPKIVTWVNGAIDKLNGLISALKPLAALLGITLKPVGHVGAWSAISPVDFGGVIDFGLKSGTGQKGPFSTKEAVGGGGGSALAGGGGGAGAVGRAGVAATAPRANVTGESAQTLTLIELARVQGQEMHELLETLKNMPTMIRDAIIVYTGGVA